MPDSSRDVPGVIVFPPLIPLAVLVVGIALDLIFPLTLLSPIPLVLRVVIGVALFALGGAMAIVADRAFKRIGTNTNPMRPALAVAKHGIFARIRNPMYVGMALIVLGIVIGFALEWTFVALLAGALVMHYGVVLREERYLERKFGDEYRTYKQSVPRYGL